MAEARFQYLTDADKQALHEQTVTVLEEVGVAFNLPAAIDLLAEAGAQVDRTKLTARIPRELIAAALKTVPRRVLLAARDPARDVVLGEGYVSVCSDGTATYMVDDLTGERRPGSAADLHRVMRLLDALPECDYVWPSISARDLDPVTANLEIEYISLSECAKHLQDEVRGPEFVAPLVTMLEAVAGASLKERPIFSAINCTVAPLQHDPAMTEASMELAKKGVPIFVMPMPMIGTTGPASVMGTCVITMAEILSAVVLLQLAAPGCAVVAAPEPAVADMRSGLYVCGAPEETLMNLACLEMAVFYGLPCQAGGLGGDARYPDYQAGAEGGTAILAALAGADSLVGFGGLDGATCYSLAEAVLDNDATGAMRRLLGAHAVDEQTSLIDEILAVGIGGHYLGRRSTRELGRSGLLWEPGIFRRGRPEGEPAQLVREAAARADEILASHEPAPLSEDVVRYAEQVIAEFAVGARHSSA
jgi:trimethylamine---corrinoid protein Co-methyltransferase